jgi:hypothetical protein
LRRALGKVNRQVDGLVLDHGGAEALRAFHIPAAQWTGTIRVPDVYGGREMGPARAHCARTRFARGEALRLESIQAASVSRERRDSPCR